MDIRNVNNCPECGSTWIHTVDSRNRGYRKRRYVCEQCNKRFNTVEVFEEEIIKILEVYNGHAR